MSEDDTSVAASRVWLITAILIFPKLFTSDTSKGIPPQRLEFSSRFEESGAQVGSLRFLLSRSKMDLSGLAIFDDIRFEPVNLQCKVGAASAAKAIDSIASALDLVLDDLSFQMQRPLRIHALEAIDITSPVNPGEQREVLSFPLPNGYDQYKLSRSVSMASEETAYPIKLRRSYNDLSRQTQDALDWYIKALHAVYDVDRFIFYWISFEILSKELGDQVSQPTRLRCQHEIVACPVCGKSTAQFRQAATILGFMTSLGIDDAMARQLWDMRQVIHGAKSFLPDKLSELARLTQVLRFITLGALKRSQGKQPSDAPNVEFDAPNISAPRLGGYREIGENDLVEWTI